MRLELQLLHLHLHDGILRLLLLLSLLCFLLILLEQLLRGLCQHRRQPCFDFWGHLNFFTRLISLRWQLHTQCLFDLLAILEAQVLVDVRHHG